MRKSIYILLITFVSCSSQTSFIPHKNPELQYLFKEYHATRESHEQSYVLINRIIEFSQHLEGREWVIPFLSRRINEFPSDPYRGHFLLLLGQEYEAQNNLPSAVHYYRKILTSKHDLITTGNSLHFITLNLLNAKDSNIRNKTLYTQTLLTRFPSQVEPAVLYHQQAKNYEQLGEWEKTYTSYQDFLSSPSVETLALKDYQSAEQWMDRYTSSRNWTYASLNELVDGIKSSLINRNVRSLLRHQSQSNFFTMSWNQEEFDKNSRIRTFNIGIFLQRSTVRFSEKLEISSNDKEAYLRTWGWSHRIPVWFFYFRRVDFPADSQIHGNWEWAGIFFGDSL